MGEDANPEADQEELVRQRLLEDEAKKKALMLQRLEQLKQEVRKDIKEDAGNVVVRMQNARDIQIKPLDLLCIQAHKNAVDGVEESKQANLELEEDDEDREEAAQMNTLQTRIATMQQLVAPSEQDQLLINVLEEAENEK